MHFVENEVKWDLLGVHDISIKSVKIWYSMSSYQNDVRSAGMWMIHLLLSEHLNLLSPDHTRSVKCDNCLAFNSTFLVCLETFVMKSCEDSSLVATV